MSAAAEGKPEGERARSFAPPDLVLAITLCAAALLLEAIAFLGSDPWIGPDLVGAGFLLVFVADVIVEPGRSIDHPAPRPAWGWSRTLVSLVVGMALLFVRPAPIAPGVVQGLAVAGAAFAVFEGLLKAGTHRR